MLAGLQVSACFFQVVSKHVPPIFQACSTSRGCRMTVSIEQISSAIDSTFIAHTAAGQVALTLVEAAEQPRRGLPEQFRTPMTLILSGPPTPLLYDDHYYLDHPVLGRHQWFMSPISSPPPLPGAAGPAAQRYQIVFT